MIANLARGLTIGLMSLGLTMGSVAFAQSADVEQGARHVQRSATLNVAMSPSQVYPGQRVRISLTVVNTGNATLTGVRITDRVPLGFKYQQNSANGSPNLVSKTPTAGRGPNALEWHVKPLAPGQQASVWFMAIPQPGVFGTRCTVGLLDPTGIHGVFSTDCVSVVKRPAPPVICGSGTHKVGNKCVPNPTPKPVVCGAGTHKVGNKCVPNIIPCPLGFHKVGNVCLPNPRPVPGPVQNQSQNQKQSQWQVQNNKQVTNVDVHNENNNSNDIDINLNK